MPKKHLLILSNLPNFSVNNNTPNLFATSLIDLLAMAALSKCVQSLLHFLLLFCLFRSAYFFYENTQDCYIVTISQIYKFRLIV